jgi:tetratricopeptide (TPR) repeat protein
MLAVFKQELSNAIDIFPNESKLYYELGYVCFLQANLIESLKNYTACLSMNPNNMDCVQSSIFLKVAQGNLAEAEEQISILQEINLHNNVQSLEIAFLISKIKFKSRNNVGEAFKELVSAIQIQIIESKSIRLL